MTELEKTHPGQTTVDDVACTVCGCVCDDLKLTCIDGSVSHFEPGCQLAEPWLLSQTAAELPVSFVGGQPAALSAAMEEASRILASSVAPLIYGLSRSSTPGQRAAVHLADRIGACIDTTASTCHAPSIMALQSAGESTSTLGEVRNRSDLVIYWGSNPAKSHPRHIQRFVDAPGHWVPRGRSDRHVVVIDVKSSETTPQADEFIQLEPGSDFEVMWTLRALVKGLPIDACAIGGIPMETLRALAERMRNCQYGVIFFGLGLTRHGIPHANVEALLRLVTDLNFHTRFVVRRMRIPGDVAGADSVLCWQTGYPFSVSLNRDYPRFNPGEFTANDLLERGEVDAVVLVGSEGVSKLSSRAQQFLNDLPSIVLDHPGVPQRVAANVRFTTAVYGIHRPGTAYRMDETPIPLRTVLDSPLPADHDILQALIEAVNAKGQANSVD